MDDAARRKRNRKKAKKAREKRNRAARKAAEAVEDSKTPDNKAPLRFTGWVTDMFLLKAGDMEPGEAGTLGMSTKVR